MLMALYLFNICADAPDPGLPGTPENLAYNDIESVVEILLEHTLHVENAVSEHDDADGEQPENSRPTKVAAPFVLGGTLLPTLPVGPPTRAPKLQALPDASLLPAPAHDVFTPPPEAA
jgi:hypothetical protein